MCLGLRAMIIAAILLTGSLITPLLPAAHAGVPGTRLLDSGPDISRGQLREDWNDLSVKVPGGYVGVIRSWDGEAWTFSPALNDLIVEGTPETGLTLKRGSVSYGATKGATALTYQSKANKLLRKTATGYRWRDMQGEWIDYDEQGRALAFGNLATKLADVERDAEGRISGFRDANGLLVITFAYDASGQLTEARDYTDRVTTYTYTAGKLTNVNDVRGYDWTFEYQGDWLKRRTDPNGHYREMKYTDTGRLLSVSDELGVMMQYKYVVDLQRDEYYVQEKDAVGGVVEKTYDAEGLLLEEVRNGRTIRSVRLDGNDLLITDANKNVTRQERDVLDRTTRIVYPDGTEESFVYWQDLRLITRAVDERGTITTLDRDAAGNVVKVTEAVGLPEQRVTDLEYDAFGQLTKHTQVVDGTTNDRVTTIEWDDHGNPDLITDAVGDVYQIESSVQGDRTKLTDPRNKEWIDERDAAGNLTRSQDPTLADEHWVYDAVGNETLYRDQLDAETTYEYDARNNILAAVDPLTHRWQWAYDARSLLTYRADPEGHSEVFEYDLEGRPIKYTDGSGLSTTAEYLDARVEGNTAATSLIRRTYPTYVSERRFDSRGRLVSAQETYSARVRNHQWTYEPAGEVASYTRSDGRTTTSTYDSLGRLVEQRLPDQTSIHLEYDPWEQVFRLIDGGGKSTEYRSDEAGRLVNEIREGGLETAYVYGPGSVLETRLEADGRKLEYSYDDRALLLSVDAYLDSTDPTPAATHSWTHNPRGDLVSYTAPEVSGTYTYDPAGRLESATTDFGAFQRSYLVGYLNNGLRKTFTSPDGTTYTYAYDNNSQLRSLTAPGRGTIAFTDYEWLAPKRIQFPGGLIQQIDSDGLLQPERVQTLDAAGNALMDRQYSYSDNGLVESVSDSGTTTSYGYDDQDQLTTASTIGGDSEAFSYDASSNRLPGSPAEAATWQYSDRNELLIAGSTTYEYDPTGRRTKKTEPGSELTYEYDPFGRLTRVKRADQSIVGEYAYDPFGRRVRKMVEGSTTWYQWDGDQLLAEFDGSGTQLVQYTYAGGYAPIQVAMGAGLGSVYDVHVDHLDTPRLLTDASGTVVWRAEYAAFGSAEVEGDPDGDLADVSFNIRFPGQYFDAETGLHYNRFRYYDPGIGRYVSADPIGQRGGINLYRYAANNPLGWIDPFGLDIAIVTGGPAGRNRAGHSAALVEGRGAYSYATVEPFGSSATGYLESQAEYRDQEVTIIETTPEQDAAFIAAFEAVAGQEYDALKNNCENAVNAGLTAAGVEGEGWHNFIPGISGERAKAESSEQNGGGSPTTVRIPQGGSVPPAFNRFNPRP